MFNDERSNNFAKYRLYGTNKEVEETMPSMIIIGIIVILVTLAFFIF